MARARVGRWLTATILVLALAAAGCSAPRGFTLSSELSGSSAAASDDGQGLRSIDFAAIPTMSLRTQWIGRFPGVRSGALAPDGALLVLAGRFDGSLGFKVLDRSGKELWEYRAFPSSFTSIRVDVFGDPPTIVAVVSDRSQKGYAYAFDSAGKLLWRRSVDGGSSVIAADDGQRFVILNYVAGTLDLLDRQNRVLATFAISPEASVRFINEENLVLVNDAAQVRLIDAGGRELWSYPVGRDLKRSVALSRDMQRIAVTTTGGDSTVYLFDPRGKLQWSRRLLLGGTNKPLFSQDGATLYVYDVGTDAGIYAFAVDDGDVLWRVFLKGPEGKRAQVRAMWRGAERLFLDYVVLAPAAGGSGAEAEVADRWLLAMDPEAQVLRRFHVGRGAQLRPARDGRSLLVLRPARAASGTDATEVTLYALAGGDSGQAMTTRRP